MRFEPFQVANGTWRISGLPTNCANVNLPTFDIAMSVCRILSDIFKAGKKEQQKEILKALGVES